VATGANSTTRIYFEELTLTFGALVISLAGTLLRKRETETMLIANTVKDLIAVVHDAIGDQFTAAAFAVVRLEQDGNADDGKYWDETAASWEVAATVNQVSTHLEAGQHLYQLPAAATAGRANATIHFTFTDNLAEAAATTVCTGGEHIVNAGTVEDMLGLLGKHQVFQVLSRQPDAPNKPLTGRLRVYKTAANAATDDGATGLVQTYNTVSTYDGDDELIKHTMTEV